MHWQDEYYLRCYELAKEGKDDHQISKILGVDPRRFSAWVRSKPALAEALEKARKETGKSGKFQEYVFGRLPQSLKELWQQIMEIHTDENADFLGEELDRLLEGRGERARQHLFLYALIKYNFSLTAARRSVNITPSVYKRWCQDPEFSDLVYSVHECKKDFFESALVELVGKGDTSAVIFANKTINRDRGYQERQEHAVAANISHRHQIDDLPLEVKRQVLLALQNKETTKTLEFQGNSKDTIDAEFIEKVPKEEFRETKSNADGQHLSPQSGPDPEIPPG